MFRFPRVCLSDFQNWAGFEINVLSYANRVLAKGNQLLPLWPVGMAQKRLGPAPNSAFSYDFNVPLISKLLTKVEN